MANASASDVSQQRLQ